MAKQQTTFTLDEILAILQEVFASSPDGRLNIGEITTGLARLNNQSAQKSFRDTLGRDVFGKKVVSVKV